MSARASAAPVASGASGRAVRMLAGAMAAVLVIAAVLSPADGFAQGARNVAVVLKINGDAAVQKAGASDWADVARGAILDSGDKLRTGRQSEIAVMFQDDKSLLKLAAETEITINATRDGANVTKRVWMGAGDLWARVTRSPDQRFDVETPTSVASVKGSTFYSHEDDLDGNRLHAVTGRYRYANDFGEIVLLGGMTGESDGQSPPRGRQTRPGELPGYGEGSDEGGDSSLHGVGDEGITPGPLRAEASSTSEINLSWQDVFDNESGFQVDRQSGEDWITLGTGGENAIGYSDGGLEATTRYCYRVRALRGEDVSPWTPIVCDSTLAADDPSGLTAEATGASAVTVRWMDNATDETGYEIYRSVDGGDYLVLATVDPDAQEYVDGELDPTLEYCYRVRVTRPEGPGRFSNSDCAQPGVALAPTALESQPLSSREIQLVWEDNSDDETGFEIQRRKEEGEYQVVTTVDPDVSTFLDADLDPGAQYCYRVRALFTGAESGYSAEACTATFPSEGDREMEVRIEFVNEDGERRELVIPLSRED